MRHLGRVVVAMIVLGASALLARGQPTGDLNGDGNFDSADFPLLAACMTGPADPPQSGCDGADADQDGKFTFRDLMRIVRKLPSRPTADCDTTWTLTRYHLGYLATLPPDSGVEGAGVTINVSDTPLCGDNAGYGPFAFSATWVGISQSDTLPYATAQLGFITGRTFPTDYAGSPPSPNPERFHKLYAEILWDSGQNGQQPQNPQFVIRLWTGAAPPPVTLQLEVWRETNFLGIGQGILLAIFVEGFPDDPMLFATYYPTFTGHGFRDPPTGVTFTSETYHTGDHVAGTVFRSCVFYDCVVFDRFLAPRLFDLDDPGVSQLNHHADENVGIRDLEFIPNSAFEIWDKRSDR